MANETAAQTLQAIKDELHARVTGASIPEFTLSDGTNTRRMTDDALQALLPVYERLVSQAVMGSGGGGKAYATFRRPS